MAMKLRQGPRRGDVAYARRPWEMPAGHSNLGSATPNGRQGDFDGAGALFTHARFRAITPAGIRTVEGAEAITHQLSSTVRRYGDGTPRTKHITTNLIIEAGDEPDTMTCRSYFTVLQAIEGFHLVPVIAGATDTFQLRDGAWGFADRLVMPDLIAT